MYSIEYTEEALAEIDNFNREIELTRQNKELMAFLETRAQQTKTVSAAEARKIVLTGKKSVYATI
jgi:hypothetical protein